MKIQSDIFKGDSFMSLLFVIAMMQLNYILRNCIKSNKFTKSQQKINHYINMDDIKQYAKKIGVLKQTIQVHSQYIYVEFERYAIIIMKTGKKETMERTERLKIILGNNGRGYHPINGDE